MQAGAYGQAQVKYCLGGKFHLIPFSVFIA